MRLANSAAFYLQASIILFFLAGSSAPTPLYALYQAAWGFSPVMVTIIFGTYALAVLAALLVVGSLSDYIGRKPVLLVATLAQLVAMVMFVYADSVGQLLVTRVLQGLSTGAAAGAVGAGMLDLDRAKGTVANSVAPMLGTALGGFVSGLFVQYLPHPTQLVYCVLGVIFALQAWGVTRMPETVTRRAGALASLKPQFRVPAALRLPVLIGTPALIATWSLAGFYGSIGPSVVKKLVGPGQHAVLFGGLALFVLASSGAVSVLFTRTRPVRHVLRFGTLALGAGVGVSLLAIDRSDVGLFFIGTAIAGMGFGASFQSVIRSVVPLAQVHERAGVLSILYVISYLAMGLPAVVAGLRVVYGGGLVATAHEFGWAVIALAATAFVGVHMQRPTSEASVSILQNAG